MESSVSETHGEQEASAYNGHFGCTCYHPLFVFNQFGDLERCALRPANVHSANDLCGFWRLSRGFEGRYLAGRIVEGLSLIKDARPDRIYRES